MPTFHQTKSILPDGQGEERGGGQADPRDEGDRAAGGRAQGTLRQDRGAREGQ